jgi:spore maturation protein CgeB
MRVMIVSSPHAFSTRDVYTGHLAGLRANLGAENVISYDIIHRFNLFHSWTTWLEEEAGSVPRELRANVLASEPVFGAAHYHEVDAVYLISPMYFPMSIIDLLRKDGFKVWAYFTECPYEDEFWSRGQASHFDACFVNDVYSLPRFKVFNPNSYYLAHSYNPAIHHPGAQPANGHEHVIMVGTGFNTRREFFSEANWEGIDLRLYGTMWDEGERDWNLRPYIRPRLIENQTTAKIYRGASIGISMHRAERTFEAEELIDKGEAYSVGPRTYELAACGLFQISDERPELKDIFAGSVPIYNSPQEMERLVRHYIANPQERRELAGQQLEAVKPHTVERRMAELLERAT